MAYADMLMDVLCAEDVDTLRLVFDQFARPITGRDRTLTWKSAPTSWSGFTRGERDLAVLTSACEDALRRDIAMEE